MKIRARLRGLWVLRREYARRVWCWVLIKLGIVKLYEVYYGESDWVSARSMLEAERFWREFQREQAGEAWVWECEETDGIEVWLSHPSREMRDEDGTQRTAQYFMIRQPVPSFIGTSVT